MVILKTEFDKKCDNINTCTSDLRLQVEMFLLMDGVVPTHVHDNTVLYVDAANMLQVSIYFSSYMKCGHISIYL
jgi:hypothetical protein